MCTLVLGLQADCFMFVLQRSPEFNDFLRKALDKNLDNRWNSVQLVQVSCPTFACCAVISQYANICTASSVDIKVPNMYTKTSIMLLFTWQILYHCIRKVTKILYVKYMLLFCGLVF